MHIEELQSYIQIALDISHSALHGNKEPFGAIIVKNRTIVGSSEKNRFPDDDLHIHAEVLAIRDACNNLKTSDLTGCHIYCSSEPCPMCLAAIYWAQISSIYYCNRENKTVRYGTPNAIHSRKPSSPGIKLKIKSIRIPYSKALEVFERDSQRKEKHNNIEVSD